MSEDRAEFPHAADSCGCDACVDGRAEYAYEIRRAVLLGASWDRSLNVEDLSPDAREMLDRAVRVAAIRESRLYADVRTAHHTLRLAASERDQAKRMYETAFEGREHAWNQLERITSACGENPEDFEISAVASLVEHTIGMASSHVADLNAKVGEIRRFWLDWPQARRDAVRELSQFVYAAIENLVRDARPASESDEVQ
jgi:hypothetical protein